MLATDRLVNGIRSGVGHGYGYTRGSGRGRVEILATGRVWVRVEIFSCGYGSGTTFLYPQTPNTVWVKKNAPCSFLTFFPKRLGIFRPNFMHLLYISIYAGIQIFIQLSAILTKLCHIKRDHPVHTVCSKCPPSAETHAGIFWHFSKTGIFGPHFPHLLPILIYARLQIFIQLSPTVTKLCHIKCDHPACV